VDSIVNVALRMGVDGPQSIELKALRALASGDRPALRQVTAAAARLDDASLHSVAWMVAAHGAEYDGVEDIVRLLRRRGPDERFAGAMWELQLAGARGRLREMEPILRGPDLPGVRGLEARASLAILPHRVVSRKTLEGLQAEVKAVPRETEPGSFLPNERIPLSRQVFLEAMLALRLGDDAEAERQAAGLEGAVIGFGANDHIVVQTIRAEVLRARGKPAEALAALGEPISPTSMVGTGEYHVAHARFLRAELLRELKRWNEALRWYETFPDPGLYDLTYLPAVHAGMGATYEGLGDVAAAKASYRRAAALLANADADFGPTLARIRARLAALP
jgi:tetratricopeptide (TPR) repeat protein